MKLNKNNIIIGAILALIIALPLIYNISVLVAKGPEPFLEKPKGEKCIMDTEEIRYNHMILLKETRNQAMREGKKVDIGLKNCRGCHSNRKGFCDRCHDKVNLKPDCFSCHYYPNE
ncbi:MAG: cytochrome C [bacterium]|nr:cytochrome C [bacterium]